MNILPNDVIELLKTFVVCMETGVTPRKGSKCHSKAKDILSQYEQVDNCGNPIIQQPDYVQSND